MIYFFPIILLYIYLAFDSPKFRLSNLFYIVLFILGVISIVRGSVGVDTPHYEFIVSTIRNGGPLSITEPGFSVIIFFLVPIFDSDSFIVRIIALLFYVLVTVYFSRADKNEKYFLISYFIPTFYFVYSMNSIRIGLASIIFMLCAQHANKLKGPWKLWIPFVSFFFHYTMLFAGIYRWATMVRWRTKEVSAAVFILSGFALIVFFNFDYFISKWMATKDIPSPSLYSGMSKAFIISVLLIGLALSKMPKQEKISLIVISSALTILFIYFTRITYGGLRALELVTFVLPIIIMNIYESYNLQFCRPLRICFFFAGLFAFSSFIRNIYLDGSLGDAPFVPYRLIFF